MYEQTSMIGPQTAEAPAPAARYYEINEETARNAHYCVHMSDYKPGSATAEYRRAVDKAAALVEAKKGPRQPLLPRQARRAAGPLRPPPCRVDQRLQPQPGQLSQPVHFRRERLQYAQARKADVP